MGEPDFNTPDFIKDAAIEGIRKIFSKYMPVNGYLVEKLFRKIYKRDNNINYSIDQIVVSTGAKQSIANVVLSSIDLETGNLISHSILGKLRRLLKWLKVFKQ